MIRPNVVDPMLVQHDPCKNCKIFSGD